MDSLTVLSLFSGCGGLDLGASLVGGFRTIAYCENEPFRQGELMSLMRAGALDKAPIYDDVRTFDARRARGLVDVVAGGDPCQPHSLAGKRKGLQDERWLWPHFRRIIEECRPRFVLRENTPGVVSTGGLITPLEDLEEMGYKAAPYKISAAEVGAWHLRERIFIIAHLDQIGRRLEQELREELQGQANFDHSGIQTTYAHLNEKRLQEREQKTLDKKGNKKSKRFCCGKSHADPYEAWELQPKRREQDIWRRLGDIVVPQQSVPAWQKIKNLAH